MKAKPVVQHCPACGGPQAQDGRRECEFCGSARVPLGMPDPRHSLRCPSCSALTSQGGSFCPGCGHSLAKVEETPTALPCPGCADPDAVMLSWGLQPSPDRPKGHRVSGCKRCGGAWVDRETLDSLFDAAARRAERRHDTDGESGRGVDRKEILPNARVVYRRCPACEQVMSRRNFGRVSGIILDECSPHGSFFDAGELKATMSFIETGGLELARVRRAREEAHIRERSKVPERSSSMSPMAHTASGDPDLYAANYDLLTAFGAWSTRWISGLF